MPSYHRRYLQLVHNTSAVDFMNDVSASANVCAMNFKDECGYGTVTVEVHRAYAHAVRSILVRVH